MADYTDISDSAVDPDAPLTSELAYAWRDNPIAIAEGALGAPRIAIGALQRITAGDSIRSRNDAVQSVETTDVTASLLGLGFAFMQAGSIRVSFSHSGTGSNAFVERLRNGVATTIASFANTLSLVSRTVDVSVLPGDYVTINNTDGGTGTNQVILSLCRFSTNGEDLYPGISARLEGNTYAA